MLHVEKRVLHPQLEENTFTVLSVFSTLIWMITFELLKAR